MDWKLIPRCILGTKIDMGVSRGARKFFKHAVVPYYIVVSYGFYVQGGVKQYSVFYAFLNKFLDMILVIEHGAFVRCENGVNDTEEASDDACWRFESPQFEKYDSTLRRPLHDLNSHCGLSLSLIFRSMHSSMESSGFHHISNSGYPFRSNRSLLFCR